MMVLFIIILINFIIIKILRRFLALLEVLYVSYIFVPARLQYKHIIIMTSISNIELEPKKKTADIYTYHSNYYQENKEKIKQQARERS